MQREDDRAKKNDGRVTEEETDCSNLNLLFDVASNPHHQLLKNQGSPEKEMEKSPSMIENDIVLPKLFIQLTNKEKEEDFMAFKGSKLPQRPKKRAKLIQQTVNLMCPGSWMCDLTLERYEVRDNTVKQRMRGLKGMTLTENFEKKKPKD